MITVGHSTGESGGSACLDDRSCGRRETGAVRIIADMLERYIVIGAATALAAVVLLLTLWSDPSSAPPTARRTIDDPIDLSGVPGFDPSHAPSQVDPRGQVTKYRLNSINSRGQLIELFGHTLTPLPDGVTRVTEPAARIHLAPTRVLGIRAERGTVLAPDNQIRSGDFVGSVVLTLFEGPTGQVVNLANDSPDARLHVFLQGARFDLELGRIESDHEVHMTGPRIDFQGVGLDLSYNQRRHRIDRLEVVHGRSLRVKTVDPGAQDEPADRTVSSDLPTSDSQPTTSASPQSPRPGRHLNTDVQRVSESKDRPIQYYRARFEDRVEVRSQGATFQADRLEIVFTLQQTTGQEPTISKLDTGRNAWTWPTQAGGGGEGQHLRFSAVPGQGYRPTPQGVLTQLAALLIAQTTTRPSTTNSSSKELPLTGDVSVTWDGRLLIEPEDSPPLDMTGPDDVLVQMVGRPVRITTQQGEHISAASVDYLSHSGRVRIIGSDGHPLKFTSVAMGVLHGQRLVVHPNLGTGQLIGPGSLRAHDTADTLKTSGIRNESDPSDDTARGLVITWNDRADLSFYRRDDPDTLLSGQRDIDALQEAVFRGEVQVRHQQFDLDCDQLTVNLTAPQDGKQALNTVLAQGNVQTHVSGSVELEAMTIGADALTVDLNEDEHGHVGPSDLVATGNVSVHQPGRTMQSGRLKVIFTPPTIPTLKTMTQPETAAVPLVYRPADPPIQRWLVGPVASGPAPPMADARPHAPMFFLARRGDTENHTDRPMVDRPQAPTGHATDRALTSQPYQVQTITAEQHVQIHLDRPALRVSADRMVADPTGDQVEFFGTPDQAARIERADGVLSGDHIVANPSGQTVHVSGPGVVSFYSAPPKPHEHPVPRQSARVTTTWTQAMHFDHRFGLAQFVGDVVSEAWNGQEMSRLSADDLRLEFTELADDRLANAPTADPSSTTFDLTAGRTRTVRTVIARQNVVFLSTQWKPEPDGSLATRLRVTGPLVSFDNVAEQIQVIGPGRMLLEDYRVRADEPDQNPSTAALFGVDRRGQVRFTGRGATLMKWSGQMLLDAFHNDMRVDTTVQMIHQSMDSQMVVQLDCQRLLADLEATGGLGVWFADAPPQPNIKAVYADDVVRVRSDRRTIRTDHLEYTGFDQSIILRADPGHLTEIQEEGRPTALTAERFRWDLPSNRLEVLRPGPARVPIQ